MTEESGSIRLTRRRLLGGLATVGSASAAAGAGTTAFFSDNESSTNNTIQAGTLDLTLDGASQSVTLFDDATSIAPGESGSDSVRLGNDGSIEGTVEISLDDIRSYENTHSTEEKNEGDDSPSDGELDEYLEVRASLGGNQLHDYTKVVNLPNSTSYTTGATLAKGETVDFVVDWKFIQPSPPNHKEVNRAQSDSIEIDMTFGLVQSGGA